MLHPPTNYKKDIEEISQYYSYRGLKKVPDKVYIKCPNCRKEIHEDSERCPDCGYKMTPEIILYKGNLMKCPNCRKNITRSSQKCSYCGFDFTYKNINNLHIIFCPKCKADIISSAEKCPFCGFRLKPENNYEEKGSDSKGLLDKIIVWIVAAVIVFVILGCIKICTRSSNLNESTSGIEEIYNNRYFVNTEVILAATSKENYEKLWNYITNGDRKAIGMMVISGQVKYLFKNDIVYLVKGGTLDCIVRPENSTEELYVACEQITPQ